MSAAHRCARSGSRQPDRQGQDINEFDPKEGDIQFPKDDHLPEDGDKSDDAEIKGHAETLLLK